MKRLRNLSFGLLVLLIGILVVATCLEKVWGTDWVVSHVYGSPWFVACWALATAAAVIYMWRRRLSRHKAVFLLHLSFVVILLGALTTHLLGVQGSVHLRRGWVVHSFTAPDGLQVPFPFQLSLDEFRVQYYPGTSAPMDFVSRFRLTENGVARQAEVSMNRVFRYGFYRFYQSRYDSDGQGTVLSVSRDPLGIGITYAGYALLLVSILLFFFDRRSTFWQLLHSLSSARVVGVVCLLLCVQTLGAQQKAPRALPRQTAASLGELYVYYNGRICPLQTLAKDFTVKLYGKPSYRGFSPEQVFTGWFFYYDDWKQEPCIRVKSAAVRHLLGIEGGYARLLDFVGTEGYKLDAERLLDAEAEQIRGVGEANERFSLVSAVATGSLWKIFPYRLPADTLQGGSPRLEWLSLADRLPQELSQDEVAFVRNCMNYVAEQVSRKDYAEVEKLAGKIRRYQQREAGEVLPSSLRWHAERCYNRVNDSFPLAVAFVVLGLVSFAYYVRCLMRRQRVGRRFSRFLLVLLGAGGLWLCGVMVLRGVVSGHVPMTNGHETMQLLAFCAVVLTLCVYRRLPLALPFGFLVCSLALMVSMLGERNPQVTPLMPVLASPLISIHVAVIMIAYALLAFVMLDGVAALVLTASRNDCNREVERLQTVSRLLLYPAVFLLAVGIFVGAVWANVSWGRYWGWDPKEVWALITLLVYALALHPTSLPGFRRPVFFHVYSVVAFLCVLVTYFGVNFLLGGMHSYA